MKILVYTFIGLSVFLQMCTLNAKRTEESGINCPSQQANKIICPEGTTLQKRILPPAGYKRIAVAPNSFAQYLRSLPLKPHGSRVLYYDGSVKDRENVYIAVVDLEIGKKDLHQCADAVMRLRAEYLWHQKQYDKIHFNFTNGFRVDYTEWMKGKRIVVKGNKTYWKSVTSPSNTYEDFWNYMETIFIYAGTASLEKELQIVRLSEMQIGDLFIQGGFPGHAVLVVDMAINATNDTVFLLAQSYMPAQDIQILVNPFDDRLSPWYAAKFTDELRTPEWLFYPTDCMRFSKN